MLLAAEASGDLPLNPWLGSRTANLATNVDETGIDKDTRTWLELQEYAPADSALVSDDRNRNGTGSAERLLDSRHVSYTRDL